MEYHSRKKTYHGTNQGVSYSANQESSFPTSVFDSQCPTGGNCERCTYKCRMKKR
ncbi:hypothetical protein HN876_00130 [archaeon]|nr:hypothetical protein [archaeon]MBT6182604.1 hypothetical protein [archaeon]MBT6606751.1 hypothetical protein [archaeon]MBT7251309.1 hypothetical protein [archaeon]